MFHEYDDTIPFNIQQFNSSVFKNIRNYYLYRKTTILSELSEQRIANFYFLYPTLKKVEIFVTFVLYQFSGCIKIPTNMNNFWESYKQKNNENNKICNYEL